MMGWFSRRGAAAADEGRWVVLDVESSGLDASRDRLLAIAAIALRRDAGAPRITLGDIGQVDPRVRQSPAQRGAQRFRIYPGARDNRIEVLGADAPHRQLVLFVDEPRRAFETWISKRQVVPPDARVVRETATARAIEQLTPGRKRHFLCGMDEQHLFIAELPYGYDTVLGEHAHNLSGGQRQRLAIARALVRNPRILVFDEATSALDYESESVVRANLEAICAGRTVIIIAHRLSALARCERILVLDRGRLVEQGTPAALLAAGGLFARLHALQSPARAA